MIRLFGLLTVFALLLLPGHTGLRDGPQGGGALREVVVTLHSPSLAGTTDSGIRSVVNREQARFAADLRQAIPRARIIWRYRLVLNGAAVLVPEQALPRLARLPGVKTVDVGAAYTVASVSVADVLRAAPRWQTGLPNSGEGMKIAIIDDGVDQSHPYFSPTGYTMPAGFPKGQTAYTTAKVVVARAFAPAGTGWRNARKPFDAEQSEHGTHVAGIAAGNAGTKADGNIISGIAPRAFIGNYKALSIPTASGVGLDGNAAEIVAAIEAAVADGMDVINLSIGEPQVEPSRDLVALALDGAARAGVVPVVAAGNDFDEFGGGSVSSPGTSARAITVAAVTTPSLQRRSSIAGFSSAGPTPLSLRLKPDVSAPGVSIVSALPGGRFEAWSGTSMACPQVAGTAALLQERHPDWSVAVLKAALIGSGSTVEVEGKPAPPTRGGGGLIDPVRADTPLIASSPPSVSFGLVSPDTSVPVQLQVSDVGGGAGVWTVAVETAEQEAGAALAVPLTVSVPGQLSITASVGAAAADGDFSGAVLLTRGAEERRIPFWLHVSRPGLATVQGVRLSAPGRYIGDTRGQPARVSRYRYPDVPANGSVSASLQGPEQVFRFTLTKPVANFGVAITHRGAGVTVEPRVIVAGNENRLTSYAALPVYLTPYLAQFGSPVLAAGALRPRPGIYHVVFDSPKPGGAGRYSFRFWVNDTQPPNTNLLRSRVGRNAPLVVAVSDTGAGTDPNTALATIDGTTRTTTWAGNTLRIATVGLTPGSHRLRLQVSDFQESRNSENVPQILPNTRVLTTTIMIR
ncbi:MAG: hypothetical protein EXQ81_06435 [Thermoleophilia bacterium]|nr:hypothetical protein [Thermoleophilia bacterium]